MSSLFLVPELITIAAAPNSNSKTPTRNLISDRVGTAWAATTGTTISVNRSNPTQPFDTIAILGCEIAPGTTYSLSTYASAAGGTAIWTSGTLTALAPANGRTQMLLFRLPPSTSANFRLTVTGGAFKIQRIISGAAIHSPRPDIGATRFVVDYSEVFRAGAYESVDEHPTQLGWDVKVSGIGDDEYREIWQPFYLQTGRKKPFLFIPLFDMPETHAADWAYGRMNDNSSTEVRSISYWVTGFKQTSLIT